MTEDGLAKNTMGDLLKKFRIYWIAGTDFFESHLSIFYNGTLEEFLSYASGAAASSFLYLTETQNFRLIFITVLGLAIAQVAIYSVLKFPVLNRAYPTGKAKPEKHPVDHSPGR